MKKPMQSLKIEGATALQLQGATANAAVDCMRKEGVMPSKPAFDNELGPIVKVDKAGSIKITEAQRPLENGVPPGEETLGSAISTFTPAAKGTPAQASTGDVRASGPSAEILRQKAQTCTFKAARITP